MKTTKYVLAALFLITLVIAAGRLAAIPDLSPSQDAAAKMTRDSDFAEDLFIKKYLAYVTNEAPIRPPLNSCDACILQCERADLAGCRRTCAASCAMP